MNKFTKILCLVLCLGMLLSMTACGNKTASKDEILAIVKADEKIAPALEGKSIVKEIVVPGKLVSLVVK